MVQSVDYPPTKENYQVFLHLRTIESNNTWSLESDGIVTLLWCPAPALL